RPYEWLKPYPRRFSATIMFLLLYLQLVWLKLLGGKIIWTVHNLYPHDTHQLSVDRACTRLLIGLLNGWISLAPSARDLAIAEYPALASIPDKVSAHAHYRSNYPPKIAKNAARKQLNLPEDRTVILYFGWIRPYKGVDLLMKAFQNLEAENISLVVAGAPLPKSLGKFLQVLANSDKRILYMPESQAPADVAVLFSAADLAVFPYRKFLNSGAALLSLTYDVPCLIKNTPPMIDLQSAVGQEWVQLFDGEISTESLKAAIAWSKRDRGEGAPNLAEFEPDLIARETLQFFETLLMKRSGNRRLN
ncbi:MAG TPA: glycosyltransferase, partial [Chroococcales cyanobacterium]